MTLLIFRDAELAELVEALSFCGGRKEGEPFDKLREAGVCA
jgi:hypothetical protein